MKNLSTDILRTILDETFTNSIGGLVLRSKPPYAASSIDFFVKFWEVELANLR